MDQYSAALLGSVERTELVAVRIAHVGQVHGAQPSLTETRWIFNRTSSMSDPCIMEVPHLLRRTALEANRPAICESGGLTVDWFTYTKRYTVVPVEQTGLPRAVGVSNGLSHPQYP